MNIGIIGTGIMGSRMALNLLKAGYTVTVHNRTPDRAQPVIAAGARWATTPAALADGVDVVITMLAHPEAVEAVALGADGFLDATAPDTIWLDCSTVHPSFTRRMAAQAAARNLHFADAPVAGSKYQAQNAELVFFVSGPGTVLETCNPLFEAMGQRVVHVGEEPGAANALKLVFNHMLATTMAAFAEAVVMGEALGISKATLLNALVGSAVAPPFLGRKRDKVENDDFSDTEFPLRWMHKDLQMAAIAAYETGASLPLGNAAKEIYGLAVRAGHGDADFAAIYALLAANQDT